MMLELRIYTTQQGKQPFTEWYSGLKDRLTRVRIRDYLLRFETGQKVDCRFVGDGIFELRLFFGPGYRIYFGKSGDKIVILLCGGDKSTQERDIKKAKAYWKDYKEKKHEEISTFDKFS